MDTEEAETLAPSITAIVMRGGGTVALYVNGITDETFGQLARKWEAEGIEVVWLKPGVMEKSPRHALYFRRAHA